MTFPQIRTVIAPLLILLAVVIATAGAAPALGGPQGKKGRPPGQEDKAGPARTPAPERSQEAAAADEEEQSRGEERSEQARGQDQSQAPGHDNRPSPQATPSGASPSPTPSGSKPPGPSTVHIEARSGVLLGQLGQVVPYTVQVEVDEPMQRLVVTAAVPPEVDIESIPLNDRVGNMSSARRGPHEDIVWVLEQVPANTPIDLLWSGRITQAGDLEATTTVEAKAEGASAAAEAQTFIAVAAVETTRARPPDRVLGKVVRLVPVVRHVVVPPQPAGSVLPVTGWSPTGMLWLAFASIWLGLVLLVLARATSRARHAAAVLVLIALIGCTQSGQEVRDPAAAPETEDATTGEQDPEEGDEEDGRSRVPDRVKGKVIYRDDQPPAPDDGTAAEAIAPPTTVTETEITYRRVVTQEPGAPATRQPDRDGDNAVSFQWDEPARNATNAASSTRLTAEQVSRLMSSLGWGRDGLTTNVTLENTSSEPLHVQGTIVLTITSAGGTVASLTSSPVDVVLAPGGSVRVSYRYLLPSGEYLLTSNFQTS
ncbi:MAG TPA: hypothetical protein VG929_05555 [Actinomycetota bacterium]|nr:hypothetical protein [Actinomycetota bacterium]